MKRTGLNGSQMMRLAELIIHALICFNTLCIATLTVVYCATLRIIHSSQTASPWNPSTFFSEQESYHYA